MNITQSRVIQIYISNFISVYFIKLKKSFKQWFLIAIVELKNYIYNLSILLVRLASLGEERLNFRK
jgi:plasmid replication initiation protein